MIDKPLEEAVQMSTKFKQGFRFFAVLAASSFIYFLFSQTPRTPAIPAFARKYQTSCSTCHNNYPELNDFGEAFKKNGFKFPKDDETFVKEPPVLLGAKAYEKVFPKAIYPGEIPGSIPIGLRYSGFATFNSKQPLALGFLPRADLFTPNTFTMIAAGSFGPNISFWIDDDISTGGSGADGGLGDGYIKFNDLGRHIGLPKDALNLRFGQFELDLPFSQARTINLSDYDIFDQASNIGSLPGTTMNPFVFGAPQRGIEIGGYPNDGNFEWSATLLNGNNDGTAARNSKDVYVRVSQRFNLERDPSARKEVQAAGPTGPRDHTSLRLGAFYYYGRNALNLDQTAFPGFGVIREPFYRVGADARFKYRKFELYALGMHARDTNLIPNGTTFTLDPASPVTFSGGFAEAEYWFYPWVIGIMRYDVVNSPTDFLNGASEHNTRSRVSPGIQFLVRANIKAEFEYQYRWRQPDPSTSQFFRANGFTAGIDYVF
jgi:opacity protein-like surface antigen